MRARPRRFSRCVSNVRKAKRGKYACYIWREIRCFLLSSGGNCVQNKNSSKPLSPIFSRYGRRSGPAVRAWVCRNPHRWASLQACSVCWSRANFTSVDRLGQKETENSKFFTTSTGHSNNICEIRYTRERYAGENLNYLFAHLQRKYGCARALAPISDAPFIGETPYRRNHAFYCD